VCYRTSNQPITTVITKIRLFFLKRKWSRLQAQITFLQRQHRQLRAEYDHRKQKELQFVFDGPFRLSFSKFESRFGPIIERVLPLENQIRFLEDEKREVRLKIVGLKSDINFGLLACNKV